MGTCDNCTERRKVRRLELGGGSGIFLCDSCLKKEIAWRKERNKVVWKPFRTKYSFKKKKRKSSNPLGLMTPKFPDPKTFLK